MYCHKLGRNMLKSFVTLTKVVLVFLNLWVLAVVLVVSLGQWRVFDSSELGTTSNSAHLIVMRELKAETHGRQAVPSVNGSLSVTNQALDALHLSPADVEGEPAVELSAQYQQKSGGQSTIAPRVTNPPALDTKVANLRHWCRQQHPQKVPYENIPKEKLNNILVDERHHLLFCQIPGVAINEWRKILLILSGVVNVSSTSSISGGDVYGKYAKLPKRLHQYSDRDRAQMLKSYLKVIFVRDPLERLVTAYRTKLLSKGSKYFHRAYGSAIIKKYRQKATAAEIKEGTSVKFSEFVKFIIDSEHSGLEALNEHWGQYYKQCHPCLVDYDMVGTFEQVERDTKSVLDKLKTSKLIRPPYVTDRKILSQNELTKVYSDIIPQEMNRIYQVYKPDYTLFSYQCPTFVHDLLKKGQVPHDY